MQEYELAGFFGVLPRQLDADVPWFYNESVYQVSHAGRTLEFRITPSYRRVEIRLSDVGGSLLEFHAEGVTEVRRVQEKDRDLLQIVTVSGGSLWLALQPEISLRQILA